MAEEARPALTRPSADLLEAAARLAEHRGFHILAALEQAGATLPQTAWVASQLRDSGALRGVAGAGFLRRLVPMEHGVDG